MKENTNITVAQPVDVSPVKPIYNDRGKIVEWKVIVKTDGIQLMRVCWMEKAFAIMPRARGKYFVSFNFDKDLAEITYLFPEGLFKQGFNRAWDFRIKMLAQITKSNIEKAK